MANRISIKRTLTPGKVPAAATLYQGELAINLIDKIIYSSTDGTDIIDLSNVAEFAALDALNVTQNTRLDGAETRLDGIDTLNGTQDTEIANLHAKDTAQDTRMDGMDTRMDGIDTSAGILGGRVTVLETRADNNDLADVALEARVTAAEGVNATQDTRLTDVEALAASAATALILRGDWDASGGAFPAPTLAPEKADYYHINVGGTMTNANPAQDDVTVVAGDNLYWHIDNDVWYKIHNSDQVTSVQGQQGDVVITKADVGLGNVADAAQSDSYTSSASTYATSKAVTDSHNALDAAKLGVNANAVSATIADTADKITTPFKITLDTDVTGEVTLDGSADVTLNVQVVDNSHSHDETTVPALVNKADTIDQDAVIIPATPTTGRPTVTANPFIYFDTTENEFVGYNPTYDEFGPIGGGGIPEYTVINTAGPHNIPRGEGYLADVVTIGAATVFNLPVIADGLLEGDWISIGMYSTADHAITISSAEHPIMGVNEDFSIDVDYQVLTFSFIDTTVGWKIVNAVGESESPNAIRAITKGTYPAGTDTFSIAYDVGFVDVLIEGLEIADTSFTADNGTTVVLSSPLLRRSYVKIVSWNHVTVGEVNAQQSMYDDTNSSVTVSNVQEALDVVTNKSELLTKILTEYSNDNILINGDMSVWQRGIDATGGGYTSIDRWILWGNNTRCTRNEALQDYLAHVQVTDANGGIGQRIENGWRYNGKTMTFSFYWQPEAGYGYNGQVEVKFSDAGSDRGQQFHDVELITAGRKEITFTLDDSGLHGDYLQIRLHMNKGVSATESARIYRAKLELGEVATPFVPIDPATNLAACQRYYYRLTHDTNHTYFGQGHNPSSTQCDAYLQHPVPMRASPGWEISSSTGFQILDTGIRNAAIGYVNGGTNGAYLTFTGVNYVVSYGALIAFKTSNDFIAFVAEL